MPKGVYIRSEEHKRHISEAKKGYRHSEEARRNMSEARKGKPRKPFSEEHRKKLSEVRKGRVLSEEWRKNLSESHKGEKHYCYGKRLSEETRKKIGDANRGERHPFYGKHLSEEHRRKIAEAHRGKVFSDEHRRNLSGRVVSEEQRRKLSERMSGENSPCWRGGISFEPYCHKFNEAFKERVREFFGRKCVECGTPENGKKLSVHHVNFNKMSCCDDTPPLFVVLCPSCHSKTNFNREYWEEHFTKIIEEQYGGECYMREEGA